MKRRLSLLPKQMQLGRDSTGLLGVFCSLQPYENDTTFAPDSKLTLHRFKDFFAILHFNPEISYPEINDTTFSYLLEIARTRSHR